MIGIHTRRGDTATRLRSRQARRCGVGSPAALRTLPFLALALAAACGGREREDTALRAAVDSALPRLERLAGLEARAPVRVERRGKAEVRAYVERQLEKELPASERDGIIAAYAAFGLMPDTLDLRRLLLDLYTEQVVGYYDPETETLYVLEGVPPAVLEPVLVHELVHALQDQHVDLDSLVSRKRGNDRQLAAQAAIEGHATLVMFAFLAEKGTGQQLDLSLLPDLQEQLRPGLEQQNEQFPVFRSAPRVIRETLIFPYLSGASFVQTLWRRTAAEASDTAMRRRAGAARWPAPIGENLPRSTEQVLHPDRFFRELDEPTEIRFDDTGSGSGSGSGTTGPTAWRVIYENTLGELEISVLLAEHLGAGADTLTRGWDGDRYRVLEALGDGGRVVVWYSVWDSAPAADGFAEAYRRVLAVRPERAGRVERLELDGRPLVLVLDAAAGVALGEVPVPGVRELVEGSTR